VLRPEALGHPLAAVLRQVQPDSCPRSHNFHCHTTCSDGSLAPAELASQAIALGLEHLAITDHHAIGAHAAVAAALQEAAERGVAVPTLWRGVEISALLEGCLVHVLALGFGDEIASLQPYLQGTASVGPALRSEAVLRAIAAELGFDGAEAWYDYEQKQPWSPSPLICEAIAADLDKRGLLQSCGTDTHGLALNGR